jgi:hypothetical protein
MRFPLSRRMQSSMSNIGHTHSALETRMDLVARQYNSRCGHGGSRDVDGVRTSDTFLNAPRALRYWRGASHSEEEGER